MYRVKQDVATGLQVGIVARAHLRADVIDVACRLQRQVVGSSDACGFTDGGLAHQLIAPVLAKCLVVDVARYRLYRYVIAFDLARDVVDIALRGDVQVVFGFDLAAQVIQGCDVHVQIFGRDNCAVLQDFFLNLLGQIDLGRQYFLALHQNFNHPDDGVLQCVELFAGQRLSVHQA